MNLQTQIIIGFILATVGSIMSDYLGTVITDLYLKIGKATKYIGILIMAKAFLDIARMLDNVIV